MIQNLNPDRTGNRDLIRILIDAKADPLIGGADSALVLAARSGHDDIFKMLLDIPGVNITGQVGALALLEAWEYGHQSIAKILIGAGADSVEAEKMKEAMEKWRG